MRGGVSADAVGLGALGDAGVGLFGGGAATATGDGGRRGRYARAVFLGEGTLVGPFFFALPLKLGGVTLGVFRIFLELVERSLEYLCRPHLSVSMFVESMYLFSFLL